MRGSRRTPGWTGDVPYLQRKPTAPWAARGTHVTSVTSRPRDVVRHAGTTRWRNLRVVPGSFVKCTGEVRYDRKHPWHLSAKTRATAGSLYRTRMTVDIKTCPFVVFGCCRMPASKRDAKHTPEFRRFSFRMCNNSAV